jgi:hypothetical protein
VSTPEIAAYRDRVSGHRALFAFGLTQDFFAEERATIPAIMDALVEAFADLEERFGVKVLGTLDDDELLVGHSGGWPWTCYILAAVPDRESVARVCDLLRTTEIGRERLWKYMKVEARLGRPLFFAEPR